MHKTKDRRGNMALCFLMQLPFFNPNYPKRALVINTTALKKHVIRIANALLCHLGHIGHLKHTYFLYKKHFCAYILHYNCPNCPNTTFIAFLINQSTFSRAVARFTTALT